MPASSLGDHSRASTRASSRQVTVEIEDSATRQTNRCAAVMSVLTCLLLLAAGVTVGVWAAINQV